MDDTVTPDFLTKINAGEIVNNPCTYVKDSIKNVGTGHQKWNRGTRVYESKGHVTAMNLLRIPGYMVGKAPVPVLVFDNASDSRLTAMSNLDKTPYAFAEDLGEIGETVRFLRNPLGSIRRLGNTFSQDVKNFQRAKRKGISPYYNVAEAIAEVYLQYRFALSPLVRSINDALMSLIDNVKPPDRRTARGFSESEGTEKLLRTAAGHQSEAWTNLSVLARSGILYEVTNPVNNWRYKYGLRFKDIPDTSWQLLPYSFMVDRMFNFSQAIRGLTSFLDPNVKILTAWTTTLSTTEKARQYNVFQSPIVTSISASVPDVYVETNFTYHREPWEPGMSDLVPGFYPKALVNSVTKVADLAALCLRLFKPS
jgi:hypothetical protein